MRYLTIILVFLTTTLLAQEENSWQPLFNGKDLSEWTQRGSNADYQLEDGVIVGTSVQTPKNSFLCTNTTYSDFILEFEVKLDHGINSGIQIRSNSKADYNKGQVHGYQVELDPSPVRRWTAGIYDEGRRGWIYPLTRNPQGQNAFIIGDWNKMRIEAIGHHIRTWVNGVQCTNLVDDMTAEGFIGLQVHGIGGDDTPGKQIRWKNMRIKTTDLENERFPAASYATEINYIPNHLTENEKRKGWRLLWDGATFEGWRTSNSVNIDTQYWDIKDDYIYSKTGEIGSTLMTKQYFENFELAFEFSLDGNKIYSQVNYGNIYGIDLNYTIADHLSKDNKYTSYLAGSFQDVIISENLSDASSSTIRFGSKNYWNKGRIIVKNGKVEHWLNNIKVAEFDTNTQLFKAFLMQIPVDFEPELSWKQNPISFFSNHQGLSIRSIKIREM